MIIRHIRADVTPPGIRRCEKCLLKLFKKVSRGCFVHINDTGTEIVYKPGPVMGGRNLVFDCYSSRSIGYYLEPLIVLGLFGKEPLRIKLRGITNDNKDPSVDTFQNATLPLLKKFGVPSEGLDLKIGMRGVPPRGVGEVKLSIPNIQDTLKAINWTKEGRVKRIKGFTFSAATAHPEAQHQMLRAASEKFDHLIEKVYMHRDQAERERRVVEKEGYKAKVSHGYGISLVAETDSGCFISADRTAFDPRIGEVGELEYENKDLRPPRNVGEETAVALGIEIMQSGVVDANHQGLLFLLCALSAKDVSKVRVGELSPHGKRVLREIKEFLGVVFDGSTEKNILKCVGFGLENLSRNAS